MKPPILEKKRSLPDQTAAESLRRVDLSGTDAGSIWNPLHTGRYLLIIKEGKKMGQNHQAARNKMGPFGCQHGRFCERNHS